MGKDLFPVGRVIKPHGIRGKIKIDYFGEDFSNFPLYREVFIEDRLGKFRAYEILEVISQPPRLILCLNGIEKAEEVQSLVGKEIFVNKEALPDLPQGEYYWREILGMGVETAEGKRIGKVKEIFRTGAHDVYVLEGEKREILLPATEDVVQNVDLERRVIKVTWMKGLWEKGDEV
jgi:16S rRNA processing protein RimM